MDAETKRWKEAVKKRKREEAAERLRRKTDLDALRNAIKARHGRSADDEGEEEV